MATLQTRSFSSIVQMIAAGVQGRANAVLDYQVGSTLRAIAEGHAGIGLWLQAQLLKLLLTTRAATSTGSDLDTWVQDFGLTRLGSKPSNGTVTFTRFTASASTPFVPLGAVVQTADGSQKFAVSADPTNSFYSASPPGYTMPASVAAITLPVISLTSGSASNVLAGAITQMATPITGVDQVVNALVFSGGGDAESDAGLRTRFQAFIASLSKATVPAIMYTVNSLQLGAQCTITENFNYDGTANNGYFYVVVDDGSGAPQQSLLTLAGAAIQPVRPLTVQYGVFPPVIIRVDVAMTVTSTVGFDHNAVIGTVGDTVAKYVNNLPLGQSLSYTKVMQVAFNAHPGVTDITNYTLNGGLSDIPATPQNVVKINSMVVV